MGGTLTSGGTRGYELKAIEANTHLVKVKSDLSDSEFDALVNKYRDLVQNTDAKRSGLDRREPQFSYTRARFFQITGNSQVISQLSTENGVISVSKLDTVASPTLVAGKRSVDSDASIRSTRSLWQYVRDIANYSVSKIARQLPGSPDNVQCIEQQNSPDHLKDLSSQGNRESNYKYDSRAGEGTVVYVIDSGIKADHVDFADNRPETRLVDNTTDYGEDTQGHGTAVASMVNGKTVGVAKKAKVVSIKATDGGTNNHPYANSILALNMALEHARENGFLQKGVVNLSWGSNSSPGGIEDFLDEIANEGLIIVAGSGNNGHNRCTFNPGATVHRKELGMNIGAVKGGDLSKASFSNFGDCVSLWAPGQDVRVASLTEPSKGWFFGLFGSDGFTTMSGTSFGKCNYSDSKHCFSIFL
jgi:subtilisin family serine protease